jgi:glucan biosynthesis protein
MSCAAQEHGSHRYDKKEAGQHHFGMQYCADHFHVGVLMSDYVEIIYIQEMKARLMCNGEIVEEYKIEQCDKCSQLRRLDHFGYQKGYDKQENIIWFCGDCR